MTLLAFAHQTEVIANVCSSRYMFTNKSSITKIKQKLWQSFIQLTVEAVQQVVMIWGEQVEADSSPSKLYSDEVHLCLRIVYHIISSTSKQFDVFTSSRAKPTLFSVCLQSTKPAVLTRAQAQLPCSLDSRHGKAGVGLQICQTLLVRLFFKVLL